MNWVYLLCAAWLLVIKAASQTPPTKYDCSQNVSSLSEMLQVDPQDQIMSKFVICVELDSMEEVLQYSNMIVPFSVVIRPAVAGERSTVTCNNSVELPLTNYQVFPLIFNTSEFVMIENIDFVGCMRPVQILWVKEVTLIGTTFSNFSPAGALEISNSPRIIVDNCRFTNNTSQGIGKTKYSGNSGGMSIGFDDNQRPLDFQSIPPEILITGTKFTNNSASASGVFLYEVSYVLKVNIFNQRGGAMAIYIGSPDYRAHVLIHNCILQGNRAQDSGGGVYMNIGGTNNNHSITITDTNFIENNGPDGGGLEITQYSDIHISEPHHAVNIINCNFWRNEANFGGGYKSLQIFVYLNTVNLYNCTFINNTALVGGALYLQSVFTVPVITQLENSIIEDCTFESNEGNRGILFVIQNSVGIRGNTVFRDNTGPALRILHCLVSLEGNISFVGNRAHPEGFSGALYFSQYGQVLLRRGVSISFINNTGNEGACIVVKRQLISGGFTQQLYNPQCFLQYEEAIYPPQEWNVSMLFEGNKAQLGPIIFTSDLNPCQWYNQEQPFFSLDSSTVWPFMEMRDNYVIRGTESVLSPEDYVQTEIHSLLIPNTTNITAPPGTIVTLNAIALDQFNRTTSAFLELLNDHDESDNVVFEPNIAQTVAGNEQISFTYSSPNMLGKTDMILRASFISTEHIPSANLTLIHELCLPGYFLEGERCECREGTNTVLFCLPDQKGILLADGLWGAPPTWSRSLVTHTCPSGYCSCTGDIEFQETEGCPLFYQDSDRICDDTREGLLCGQCKGDLGVGLLTNICRKYQYSFAQAYLLIPIYLILLVIGLVLIVRLGIHLPTIFRGFLFYIQVSSVAVAYLPKTFRLRTDVMDCMWSATALYVPYDFSFHANLTSLESYGLKYLTPLVALIVVPIAARAGHSSHSKYWHGVWTIIVLMYTRAVDTSISLLHCPTLHGQLSTGELDIVTPWFFDGSVRCFQGAHIFLTIVSLAMLVFLLALIPLTALIIYHRKIKRTGSSLERVEKLSVAITAGFKDEYKWWPVVELTCRFAFITVVLVIPGLTFVPLILSLMLLVLLITALPYKSKWANAAEIFVLFCLVALLALGNTTPVIIASKELEHFTLWPLFFLPVAVGGVVFVGKIAYQLGNWCKARRRSVKRRLKNSAANSAASRLQIFTSSLSPRSHGKRHVTMTTVSFDDVEVEDEYELVEPAATSVTQVDTINN